MDNFRFAVDIYNILICKPLYTAGLFLSTLGPLATKELLSNLTLQSGHVAEVACHKMDSDGTFWIRRIVSPQARAHLIQLGFSCRYVVFVVEYSVTLEAL